MKIVEAIDRSIVIRNLKDLNPLLQVVAKWMLYVGVNGKMSSEETTIQASLVRDFIYENYSHLTIHEIELAYTLAVTNKLEDAEYYGYFSPLYVGKVLDGYLYYRKREMAELVRRKEKFNWMKLEEQNKIKPEEECDLMIKIFEDFYVEYKEKGEINDVFNLCWNYLRNQVFAGNRYFFSIWTNPKEKEYTEAMEYATEKSNQKQNIFFNIYKTIDKGNDIKKIARNYCVQKYFEQIDIKEFVKNIKPEHFKPKN